MTGRNLKRKGGVHGVPQKQATVLPSFDQCGMLSSSFAFADPTTLVRASRVCSLLHVAANEAARTQAASLVQILESWGESELSKHILDQVTCH